MMSGGLMDWTRLGRFFRLTGKLPGLHYDARVAVFNLQDLPNPPSDPAIDRTGLQADLSNLPPRPRLTQSAEPADPRDDA